MKRAMSVVFPMVAILPGCVTSRAQEFRPAGNAVTTSPQGDPAAAYEVQHQGERMAEVQVWSKGVFKEKNDDPTYLHVGFEARNVGTRPVTLDPSLFSVDVFAPDGKQVNGRLTTLSPADPEQLNVPPSSARDFEAIFALPRAIGPEDVNSFRVRWGLALEDGNRYVQFTQFTPDTTRNSEYAYGYVFAPAWGWYDPFFHDPLLPPAVIVRHAPIRHVVISRPRHHR
jgi:hypothetical protein